MTRRVLNFTRLAKLAFLAGALHGATIMCHVSSRCRSLLLNVLITLPRWRISQSHCSTALILLDLGRRRGNKLGEALTLSNNKSKWVSDGSLYHRRTPYPFAVCRSLPFGKLCEQFKGSIPLPLGKFCLSVFPTVAVKVLIR